MGTIVLDPGKSTIKGVKLNNKYELENVLMLKSKTERKLTFAGCDDSAKAGQYQVDIPDIGRYLVGEGVENYNSERTKVNTHFKVCILTSIALLSNSNEPVDVILGCPSSDYSNTQIVQDYKNMLPIKKFSIIVNDEVKVIDLKSVTVYPEGMMVKTRMICKREFPKSEVISCIDIGGYNTNLRQYDQAGNLLKNVSLNNAGINSLEIQLKDELRTVVDGSLYSIDAINMSRAIAEGRISQIGAFNSNTYSNSEEFLKFNITNYIENHIFDKLLLRGIDLKSIGNLNALSGGGSVIVKKYMADTLKNNFDNIYFAEDPQYENIASYISRYLLTLAKTEVLPMKKARHIVSSLLAINFGENITIGGMDILKYSNKDLELENDDDIDDSEVTDPLSIVETTEPVATKNSPAASKASTKESAVGKDTAKTSEVADN